MALMYMAIDIMDGYGLIVTKCIMNACQRRQSAAVLAVYFIPGSISRLLHS